MSCFDKAANIHLAGGRNSLTFTLDGVKYYVSVKDILKAVKYPSFSASIVKVKNGSETKPYPNLPNGRNGEKTDKAKKRKFSLYLFETEENLEETETWKRL